MPHQQVATCPCCRKQAVTDAHTDGIEVHFGWRYQDTVPQSYCRTCRSAHCSPKKQNCEQGRVGRHG